MHFLLSFFLFVMPVSAQQQEEAPIRRIDPEVVMNDISARLNLSGRQIKKLRKDLEGRAKKFDKNMKIYDKNLREEMKYHEKNEESKSVMRALSDGVNDTIRGYLDEQQQVLFDQYLAEKEKDLHPDFAERQAKEATDGATAAAKTSDAEALAPIIEEAKTLAEKKKRVVLKKKNRKRKAAGAGNVVPAGSKGTAKKKVSRKTESELPATVMPPAASAAPAAAGPADPLEEDPLSSGSSKPAGGSAVPSL